MERMLSELIPERWNREFFEHTYEGPDDMPGHMKSSVIGAAFSVPVSRGLALGRERSVLLCEHRDAGGWGGGHSRKVAVTMVKAGASTQTVKLTPSVASGAAVDLTPDLTRLVAAMPSAPGLAHVFVEDATAALTVSNLATANCLGAMANRVVPSVSKVDAPAAKAMVLGAAGIGVPFVDNKLCLDGLQACVINHGASSTTVNLTVTLHVGQ